MIFRLIFLLSLLLSFGYAFDFVRRSFRIVNESLDPCENFYRHACPLIPEANDLIAFSYQDTLTELAAEQKDSFWQNLKIEKILENANNELEVSEFLTQMFRTRCESKSDTYQFLEHLEYLIYGGKCILYQCLSQLAKDKNCTRATQLLRSELQSLTNLPIENVLSIVYSLSDAKNAVSEVSAILDGDLREGVEIVRNLVNEMVAISKDWIDKTPWAVNTGAVDVIKAYTDQLQLHVDYAIVLREHLDYLSKLEQNYLKCVEEVGAIGDERLFCVFSANRKTVSPSGNADVIGHPQLHFPYEIYDMAQNVGEFAAMIGAVGNVVGHIVSRMLIKSPNSTNRPFFSIESMNCITSQFQKTSDFFTEIPSHADLSGIPGYVEHCRDSGTSSSYYLRNDILGNQLAYSMFEDRYESRLQEEYMKLKTRTVTMQQLFFYAHAFTLCAENSIEKYSIPNNIRMNALAQHPAFQEAFQCSPDSTMMQSVNRECIIFGENAPQTRRR